jgi:ABC-type uncharacterized transport system substrate-binding protein
MATQASLFQIPKSYLTRTLLVVGAVLLCFNVSAATIAVVLSENSAPYLEVLNAIRSGVGNEHSVIQLVADQTDVLETAPSTSLIITVGVKAAESVVKYSPKIPVIAALVPRDWYIHGGQSQLATGQRMSTAVFLDQPFSRQLRLVKEALPKASRLGVVLSSAQSWQLRELQSQAKSFHISIIEETLGPNQRLVESLEEVLRNSDLLLALPDSEVFNRGTAQTIFLTTYRYRVPVVGYSHSLTRAGALVSIYSSPAQIGQYAAEIALKTLSNGSIKLPPAQFPRYYSISTNEHVARSLGVDLPNEATLLGHLREGDGLD